MTPLWIDRRHGNSNQPNAPDPHRDGFADRSINSMATDDTERTDHTPYCALHP
jgi:hypothetical protein